MKKLLSLLLIFIMTLLCLASCAGDGEGDDSVVDTAPDTSAVDTSTETDVGEDEYEFIPTSEKKSLRINYNTAGIHVFGKRVFQDRNYLACDYSGSGIEFVVEVEGGDLTVVTRTDGECRFLVTLDGAVQTYDGKNYATVNGDGNIVISRLAEGKHTVRIIKLTGYETARAAFRMLEFYGTFLTKEVSADKDSYIEFLGGSSAAGLGAEGENATEAYAYKIANSLDAEYTIMAMNDTNLLANISAAYLCTSIKRDANIAYDFALKPAVTVIHIGSNGQNADSFTVAYRALCEAVKSKNGKLSKIVCVYSNSDTVAANAIKDICDALGGEQVGMFFVGVDVKESGTLTSSEQNALAAAVAPTVERAIVAEVSADSIKAGTGDPDIKIDNNASEWYD